MLFQKVKAEFPSIFSIKKPLDFTLTRFNKLFLFAYNLKTNCTFCVLNLK